MLCISRGDNRGAADVIMLAEIESVLSIDCVPRSWGILRNLMSGDSNGQLFTGESNFQMRRTALKPDALIMLCTDPSRTIFQNRNDSRRVQLRKDLLLPVPDPPLLPKPRERAGPPREGGAAQTRADRLPAQPSAPARRLPLQGLQGLHVRHDHCSAPAITESPPSTLLTQLYCK